METNDAERGPDSDADQVDAGAGGGEFGGWPGGTPGVGGPSSGGDQGRGPLPSWDRRLGLYALVQPIVAGRRVLELWPHLLDEGENLRVAGASEVASLAPTVPSLPMAEGAVDLVLCPNFLPVARDADAGPWLAEIARVLAGGGLCVLRAPVPDAKAAAHAESEPGGGVRRWIPPGLFAEVVVVDEVAFGGVSFRVAGTEDLAIVGDLSPLAAAADFQILVCSRDAGGLPPLGESLLVPLPGFPEPAARGHGERSEAAPAGVFTSEVAAEVADVATMRAALAAAHAALAAAEQARDDSRLSAAASDDRAAAVDATISSLRAAVQRQLRQLADVEVTLARLNVERDEAVISTDAAEVRIHTLEAALRRREWEVDALRRDLARLGRTPGPER